MLQSLVNALKKTAHREPRTENRNMKVLIIKLSSLGDILHAGAAVKYVRENYKKPIEMHWLVNDNLASFVEATGLADKVIPFNRNAWNNVRNILPNLGDFCRKIRFLNKEIRSIF